MNRLIVRLLVLLGLISLTACGLPGAAVRSVGTLGRTGESLGRSLSKLN